jgi:hypothetical protein
MLKITKLLITKQPLNQDKKISRDSEPLECYLIIDVYLDQFKNKQILLNKIDHRFLGTTKLFSE